MPVRSSIQSARSLPISLVRPLRLVMLFTSSDHVRFGGVTTLDVKLMLYEDVALLGYVEGVTPQAVRRRFLLVCVFEDARDFAVLPGDEHGVGQRPHVGPRPVDRRLARVVGLFLGKLDQLGHRLARGNIEDRAKLLPLVHYVGLALEDVLDRRVEDEDGGRNGQRGPYERPESAHPQKLAPSQGILL